MLKALPQGFPVVPGATVINAGSGRELAFRIEYRTDKTPSSVNALLRDTPGWTETAASSAVTLEMIHHADRGTTDFIARWVVTTRQESSTIVVEFSPLPLSLAPPKPQ